ITPQGKLTTLYSFAPDSSRELAQMAKNPTRGWSRLPTGTSTGRRQPVGLTGSSTAVGRYFLDSAKHARNSVSCYWQQLDQFVGPGLHRSRLRHLFDNWG